MTCSNGPPAPSGDVKCDVEVGREIVFVFFV